MISVAALVTGCAITYRTVEPPAPANPQSPIGPGGIPTGSDVIEAAQRNLPPRVAAAVAALVSDKSWKQTEQIARPFQGRLEHRYFDSSAEPDRGPWVLASTGADAREVCDLLDVKPTDPCEDVSLSDEGRHVYFGERDNTDIRVATNESKQLAYAIGKSMTWDSSLVPSIDTNLVPSGLNDQGIWRVEEGLMAVPASLGNVSFTRTKFADTTTDDGVLSFEDVGANVPFAGFRVGLSSDAVFTDVTVDGLPGLHIAFDSVGGSDTYQFLIVNYEGGCVRVRSFNSPKGDEAIRSLIDP